MEHEALTRYLRELKKALVCPRSDRERLLSRAETRLNAFLEENPGGYDSLVLAFGPPQTFAEEMLDTLDPEELDKARKNRLWFRRGVAVLAAVALILCAVFWGWKWYQAQEIINGDFRIVQDDPVIVPEDEFNSIFDLDSDSSN